MIEGGHFLRKGETRTNTTLRCVRWVCLRALPCHALHPDDPVIPQHSPAAPAAGPVLVAGLQR